MATDETRPLLMTDKPLPDQSRSGFAPPTTPSDLPSGAQIMETMRRVTVISPKGMPTTQGSSRPTRGYPRSSSGECTSGESITEKSEDKASESPDGSSGSDEPATTVLNTGEGQAQESVPDTPAAAAPLSEQPAATEQNTGKGDKPKLPRPTGVATCPRCCSDNTKFCYYNNYNVKQPRYFCKACQRYWTAGGTLRNVPVGAGRRKNKSAQAREQENAAAEIAKQAGLAAAAAASAYAGQFRNLLLDPALALSASAAALQKAPAISSLVAANPLMNSVLPVNALAVNSLGQVGMNQVAQKLTQLQQGAQLADSRLAGAILAGGGLGLNLLENAAAPGVSHTRVEEADDGSMGGRRVRSRQETVTIASEDASLLALSIEARNSKLDAAAAASFQPFNSASAAPNPAALSQNTTQVDWLNFAAVAAAAGQQQAAAQQAAAQKMLQQQAQQLQQAAALQQAAQLQAAVNWTQGQNPYLSGLWPYNLYASPPTWPAGGNSPATDVVANATANQVASSQQAIVANSQSASVSAAMWGNGAAAAFPAVLAGGANPGWSPWGTSALASLGGANGMTANLLPAQQLGLGNAGALLNGLAVSQALPGVSHGLVPTDGLPHGL